MVGWHGIGVLDIYDGVHSKGHSYYAAPLLSSANPDLRPSSHTKLAHRWK